MNVFVKAILQSKIETIKSSMESLDVTLSINSTLKYGITPLYLACKVGDSKIVDYLLNNGAKSSINTPTKNGNTCLMVAVANNNIDLVKVLLSYGADPNVARPSDGTIPIMIAAYNGYSKIFNSLVHETDLSIKDNYGNTTSDIVKMRITQIEKGNEPINNAEDVVVILEGILDDLNPTDNFTRTVSNRTFRTARSGKAGGKNHMRKSGKKQKMSARKKVKRMSKTRHSK